MSSSEPNHLTDDLVPREYIRRFHELEKRWQTNPAVEGELFKIAMLLRGKFVAPFRHWLENSNTKGKAKVLDEKLWSIYRALANPSNLKELIIGVEMTIHARHKRGCFISEVSEIRNEKDLIDVGADLTKFKGKVEFSERWG